MVQLKMKFLTNENGMSTKTCLFVCATEHAFECAIIFKIPDITRLYLYSL